MTLTNDAAALYAQLFPVLLVVLAIEGRGINYGKLGPGWKRTLITARWVVVGMCSGGMIMAVTLVSVPSESWGWLSVEVVSKFIQYAFIAAVLGVTGLFNAFQKEEIERELRK